jgi:hypothetical protein
MLSPEWWPHLPPDHHLSPGPVTLLTQECLTRNPAKVPVPICFLLIYLFGGTRV